MSDDKLKELLDETRLVMLGAQLLLGLQYRAAFTDAFERVPSPFAAADAAALLLILATVACLLATPALHQIAEHGHVGGTIVRHASRNLKISLLPLGMALSLDVAIGFVGTVGVQIAIAGGAIFILAAGTAWYAIPLLASEEKPEEPVQDKQQPLEVRIIQALTELRVILPGAQALFGFQFTAVLTESFERLPFGSKVVHLASLAAVAITIILLIAPAAYHRLAAHGHAEERVLRYTSHMMLWALGLLSIGLVGDAYVTVRKISQMPLLAAVIALLALLGFIAVLYLIPLTARHNNSA